MNRVINGTLFVNSFVPTGNPGEYTFTGATYTNIADATGDGAFDLDIGFVLFVLASDVNTALVVPGIVHRYRLTELNVINTNTIDGTMVWDEVGNEVDMPTNGSTAMISERGSNLGLGFSVSTQNYPTLDAGMDDASIIEEFRNYIDQLATSFHDVDFYEGATPPYIADVDAYSFMDAAGFPTGQNRDVIFKIDPKQCDYSRGIGIYIIGCMSMTDLGKLLVFRLNYDIHNLGQNCKGGATFNQVTNFLVTTAANILFWGKILQIPATLLDNTTLEVECRLTRVGSGSADNHSGDLGLKHILLRPEGG